MIRVLVRSKGAGRALLLYYVDPANNREVSRSAGTADRREAERAAARWEAELLEHRGANNDGWEYFRLRFEDEHLSTLSKKGRLAYGTALNHLARVTKVNTVSEITASTISQFQAVLIREERPLTSIATYLTHIRKALNWAARMGIIAKAPSFSLPRSGKRRFMRGRPLTEAEYKRMLQACDTVCGVESLKYRRLIELMWLTGFRLSEAMLCSWDSPPIQVNLQSQPYPQMVFYLEGHKSRQDDAVPMCPDFAAWLRATPRNARTGPVAPVPLQTVDRVSELLSEVGRRAKILVNDQGKFASAHDLRRAFGTRWAPLVRPLTLQKLMRHANIETTLKYYVGISAQDAGAELWSVPTIVPKRGRKSG